MKGLAAVCSLVVDCYRFLADSLSLLHQAAEGQGAPETLLLSGRKTNSLHFTCWTSTRSNVVLTLRRVCPFRILTLLSGWPASRETISLKLTERFTPLTVSASAAAQSTTWTGWKVHFVCLLNVGAWALIRAIQDFNLPPVPCRKNLFGWHSQMWQVQQFGQARSVDLCLCWVLNYFLLLIFVKVNR